MFTLLKHLKKTLSSVSFPNRQLSSPFSVSSLHVWMFYPFQLLALLSECKWHMQSLKASYWRLDVFTIILFYSIPFYSLFLLSRMKCLIILRAGECSRHISFISLDIILTLNWVGQVHNTSLSLSLLLTWTHTHTKVVENRRKTEEMCPKSSPLFCLILKTKRGLTLITKDKAKPLDPKTVLGK